MSGTAPRDRLACAGNGRGTDFGLRCKGDRMHALTLLAGVCELGAVVVHRESAPAPACILSQLTGRDRGIPHG